VRGALQELPTLHQGLGMSFFYASSLLGGALCVAIASQILQVNASMTIAADLVKMPLLQSLNLSALHAVASGIQSFNVQGWVQGVLPLGALHAFLMRVFTQGLLLIAIFGACLTGCAMMLAWKEYHDH
jgi:hypothetical protein